MILQLQKAAPPHALVLKEPLAVGPPRGQLTMTLEGVTLAAALPVSPFHITQSPFVLVDRVQILVYNDLMLPDSVPLQISRHHLAFIAHEGRVGVVDRGSTLGSWVDGQQLGGRLASLAPCFLLGQKGFWC